MPNVTQETKRKISEGLKKFYAGAKRVGAGAVTLGARGVIKATPNKTVRRLAIGAVGGASMGAAGLGAAGTVYGGAGGALVGAMNKTLIKHNALKSGANSATAALAKAGEATGRFKAKNSYGKVVTMPYGASAGAKMAGKAIGTGAAIVGGAAGGLAGALDKRFQKKATSAVEKRAKRKL